MMQKPFPEAKGVSYYVSSYLSPILPRVIVSVIVPAVSLL